MNGKTQDGIENRQFWENLEYTNDMFAKDNPLQIWKSQDKLEIFLTNIRSKEKIIELYNHALKESDGSEEFFDGLKRFLDFLLLEHHDNKFFEIAGYIANSLHRWAGQAKNLSEGLKRLEIVRKIVEYMEGSERYKVKVWLERRVFRRQWLSEIYRHIADVLRQAEDSGSMLDYPETAEEMVRKAQLNHEWIIRQGYHNKRKRKENPDYDTLAHAFVDAAILERFKAKSGFALFDESKLRARKLTEQAVQCLLNHLVYKKLLQEEYLLLYSSPKVIENAKVPPGKLHNQIAFIYENHGTSLQEATLKEDDLWRAKKVYEIAIEHAERCGNEQTVARCLKGRTWVLRNLNLKEALEAAVDSDSYCQQHLPNHKELHHQSEKIREVLSVHWGFRIGLSNGNHELAFLEESDEESEYLNRHKSPRRAKRLPEEFTQLLQSLEAPSDVVDYIRKIKIELCNDDSFGVYSNLGWFGDVVSKRFSDALQVSPQTVDILEKLLCDEIPAYYSNEGVDETEGIETFQELSHPYEFYKQIMESKQRLQINIDRRVLDRLSFRRGAEIIDAQLFSACCFYLSAAIAEAKIHKAEAGLKYLKAAETLLRGNDTYKAEALEFMDKASMCGDLYTEAQAHMRIVQLGSLDDHDKLYHLHAVTHKIRLFSATFWGADRVENLEDKCIELLQEAEKELSLLSFSNQAQEYRKAEGIFNAVESYRTGVFLDTRCRYLSYLSPKGMRKLRACTCEEIEGLEEGENENAARERRDQLFRELNLQPSVLFEANAPTRLSTLMESMQKWEAWFSRPLGIVIYSWLRSDQKHHLVSALYIDSKNVKHKSWEVPSRLEIQMLTYLADDSWNQRKMYDDECSEKVQETIERAYDALIEPLTDLLTPLQEENGVLCIVPDEKLMKVPFHVLGCKDEEILIQKVQVVYTSSATIWLHCQNRLPKGNRWTIYGFDQDVIDTGVIDNIMQRNPAWYFAVSADEFENLIQKPHSVVCVVGHGKVSKEDESFVKKGEAYVGDTKIGARAITHTQADLFVTTACRIGAWDFTNRQSLSFPFRIFSGDVGSCVMPSAEVPIKEGTWFAERFLSYIKPTEETQDHPPLLVDAFQKTCFDAIDDGQSSYVWWPYRLWGRISFLPAQRYS